MKAKAIVSKHNGVRKAPASNPGVESLMKRLSAVESRLAEQKTDNSALMAAGSMLIAPGAQHSVRLPTYSPISTSQATFSRTYSISATEAGQPFAMMLRPTIAEFFGYSGSPVAVPLTSLIVSGQVTPTGFSARYSESASAGYVGDESRGLNSSGYAVISYTTATDGLEFTLVNNSGYNTAVNILLFFEGTQSASSTTYLFPHTSATVTVLASDVDEVRIGAAQTGGSTYQPYGTGSISFSWSDPDASSITLDEFVQPLVSDRWIDATNKVQLYRISAMSILASYTGNALESGGVIASTRVPSHWSPDQDTVYASICKLPPSEFYRGPIINGAYAWRLPLDLDEMEFIDIAAKPVDMTNLVVAGIFGDNESSIEVTVNVVVEFVSTLQIFDKQRNPAFTDAYSNLMHHLAKIPCATCNPKHSSLLNALKGGAKTAAKAIRVGSDIIRKHPELVQLAQNALLALAAM